MMPFRSRNVIGSQLTDIFQADNGVTVILIGGVLGTITKIDKLNYDYRDM